MSNGVELERRLNGWQLWAIAVGMVISGQYFGWNIGFLHASVLSMLLAFLLVSVFYCGFMYFYIQLAIKMPQTGGVMLYLAQSGWPRLSVVAGWAALMEYFFAVVAIALAMGVYAHGLWPALSPRSVTVLVLVLLTAVNIVGVQQSAQFELVATVLALAGIGLFVVASWHPQEWGLFKIQHLPMTAHGVLAAMPFVLWLYLGIEGSTLSAEEVGDAKNLLPKAIVAALLVLVVGALLTVLQVAFVLPKALQGVDNPLPTALSLRSSLGSWSVRVVSVFGLFGLLASLNGLLIASSRQLFALSRDGWAPSCLSSLSSRGSPGVALCVLLLLSLVLQACVAVSVLLRLSILGVLFVYAGGMLAWFSYYAKGGRSPWLRLFGLPTVVSLLCVFCIACVLHSFF